MLGKNIVHSTKKDGMLYSLPCTVWKYQDFSIIQILHEINFGESRSCKKAVFVIFGALSFVNLDIFSLQKLQKFTKIRIQGL